MLACGLEGDVTPRAVWAFGSDRRARIRRDALQRVRHAYPAGARAPPRRRQRLGQSGHHPGLCGLRPRPARSRSAVPRRERYGLHGHARGSWPFLLNRIGIPTVGISEYSSPGLCPYWPCWSRRPVPSRRRPAGPSSFSPSPSRSSGAGRSEGQRPVASARGDQHGHAHSPRNIGLVGRECSRGHCPWGAARTPWWGRRIRGPVARSDGPADCVHPGDGTRHRNEGPNVGSGSDALPHSRSDHPRPGSS